MKVTMNEEDFEKYDRGETHSNKGLRDKEEHLKVFPDIAQIEEDDLPKSEVINTEIVYKDRYVESESATIGRRLFTGAANMLGDILDDPEVQRRLSELAHTILHYKIIPNIKSTINKIKTENVFSRDRRNDRQENVKKDTLFIVREEVNIFIFRKFTDTPEDVFIVTEDQAEMILAETRKRAKELSAMIYLLSNLYIKDKKNKEDRFLEQTYIKQLLSDEATNMMRLLIEKREIQLIDDETALAFTGFLNGYIRNVQQLIPISVKKGASK